MDINTRIRSVLQLALFFAYVLAFIFEGAAFYSLAGHHGTDPAGMVMAAVICVFLGLVTGGFLIKDIHAARRVMPGGMAVCFAFSCVFFFPPSFM